MSRPLVHRRQSFWRLGTFGAAFGTNFLLLFGCTPLHDLDAVMRGDGSAGAASATQGGASAGGSAGSAGSARGGGPHGGTPNANAGAGAALSAGDAGTGGDAGFGAGGGSGGSAGGSSGSDAGAAFGGAPNVGGQAGAPAGGSGDAAGTSARAGASSSGGMSGTGGQAGSTAAGGSGGDAPELPIDLPNNPVSGTFVLSSDATWEVNGTQIPTFEIHTPTASYWVVKSLGEIVSIVDAGGADAHQWIDFSSGFRPNRGLPSYTTFGAGETMTTTLDSDSQTPTHARLFSTSPSWRLVWDFYPTHVTLTVNAAPSPYGMAYRGVPGGSLDANDRFVLADGTAQSAMTSSVIDWAGPTEWVYVADPTVMRSLFAIQHGDDTLTDRYQVKDNDSSLVSFGDGKLTQLPQRFSFGVVDSSDYEKVKARADFVMGAIR